MTAKMDLQPLWDWFRILHETTGIKLTIFYDAFDRARFFNGFLTSVRLMAVCLVASVAIGVVGAWIQGSGLRVLRLITQGYIQFFRISLPALNNNLVNLIKTTTIAYAIAVPEMLYVANQIWSDESNVPEMMNVLLITYVSLVGILVWVMGRWERALRIPGYSPA